MNDEDRSSRSPDIGPLSGTFPTKGNGPSLVRVAFQSDSWFVRPTNRLDQDGEEQDHAIVHFVSVNSNQRPRAFIVSQGIGEHAVPVNANNYSIYT